MTQPTVYDRSFDFSPLAPSNIASAGTRLNAELDALGTFTSEVATNLALIQRDDGQLANFSVTPDSLSPQTRALIVAGWTPKGTWAAGKSYRVGDVVTRSGTGYACMVAHLAGSDFSAYLAAGFWMQFYSQNLTPGAGSITPSMLASNFALPMANLQGYTAPGAAGPTTMTEYFDREIWVDDYVQASDNGDDALAIMRAYNSLETHKAKLLFSSRIYNLKSGCAFSKPVFLQGQFGPETQGEPGSPGFYGTVFSIDSNTFTPFTWSGGDANGARGGGAADIVVTQTHPTPATGWSPTVYPFVFNCSGVAGALRFERIHAYGVYDLLNLRNGGRHYLHNILGQVFHKAIYITETYDIPIIGRVHIWPFWTGNPAVIQWQQANGDVLTLGRCDGIRVEVLFCLGYRAAVRFETGYDDSGNNTGSVTEFSFGFLYGDFCQYGILGDTDNFTGYVGHLYHFAQKFTNDGTLQYLPNSLGYLVNGSGTRVSIGRFRELGVDLSAIRLRGNNNSLDISMPAQITYNGTGTGSAAVIIDPVASGQSGNQVYFGKDPEYYDRYGSVSGGVAGSKLSTSGSGGVVQGMLQNITDSAMTSALRGAAGNSSTAPKIFPYGPEDNVGITLSAKGAANVRLENGNGVLLQAYNSGASGTSYPNYVTIGGAQAGSAPVISASGPDTDITVFLQGKGAGGAVLGSGGGKVGFFGASPASKTTLTGSRGGNAALANLLTVLASLGLISDGTSA